MATVRDRALVGKHDEIGRAYIKLDPQRYGDFLTHEVWYDLEDNSGRILLRISMEGEKDEIGFYFGRAFRTLKRAESEMIRTIVDKVLLSSTVSLIVELPLMFDPSSSDDANDPPVFDAEGHQGPDQVDGPPHRLQRDHQQAYRPLQVRPRYVVRVCHSSA